MERSVLNYFVVILLVSISITVQLCESNPMKSEKRSKRNYNIVQEDMETPVKCNEVPDTVLNNILGPAFNRRYMSVDPPKPVQDPVDTNGKRETENLPPFYVDDTYALEISDLPAWEVNTHAVQANPDPPQNLIETETENGTIVKRDLSGMAPKFKRGRNTSHKRPWECEARIKWLDLGKDYYPRYLRTVECTKHLCWYGHYTCQPRSFTVKLLRRRRGECVTSKHKIGITGMPEDLRELWIWEERAVNFCCDCAAPGSH